MIGYDSPHLKQREMLTRRAQVDQMMDVGPMSEYEMVLNQHMILFLEIRVARHVRPKMLGSVS